MSPYSCAFLLIVLKFRIFSRYLVEVTFFIITFVFKIGQLKTRIVEVNIILN